MRRYLDPAALAGVGEELRAAGSEVEAHAGDVTDVDVRERLVAAVREAGGLATLVHAAGLSPTMASAERIFRENLEATAVH